MVLIETAKRKKEMEWAVLVSEQVNGLTDGIAGHRVWWISVDV